MSGGEAWWILFILIIFFQLLLTLLLPLSILTFIGNDKFIRNIHLVCLCVYSAQSFWKDAVLYGGGMALLYEVGNITDTAVHPDFKLSDSSNDIALIKVSNIVPCVLIKLLTAVSISKSVFLVIKTTSKRFGQEVVLGLLSLIDLTAT